MEFHCQEINLWESLNFKRLFSFNSDFSDSMQSTDFVPNYVDGRNTGLISVPHRDAVRDQVMIETILGVACGKTSSTL
jgi:hypothetical protein